MRLPELKKFTPAALGLVIVGYILPWLSGSGAALSFHAYDLAEWTALMPASSAETPPLLTAFLLRLPLLCIGVISAVFSLHQRGWARAAFIGVWLALAGANLPPFEFLARPDNPNYRQQAALAGLTLAAGGAVMLPFATRTIKTKWSVIIAAAAGAAAALIGLARGHALLSDYGLDLRGGVGGVSCAAGFILCALIYIRRAPEAG